MNRIDKSNQRTKPHKRPENDPKRPPTRPQNDKKRSKTTKTPSKTTSFGGLGPLLGALGPSWDGLGGHLGTNKSQDRKPHEKFPSVAAIWGRFWHPNWRPKRPQSDPKTSQKSTRKMHHFFIPLGVVLERSWVDLGPDLGSKKQNK